MTSLKKLTALLGAGALVFAMTGTAFGGVVVYATVDGHDASTSANNSPEFWGEDCFKLDAGQGDLGSGVSTYELGASYDKVIVKAGSTNQGDPNTLTIYNDVAAGETVWADYNPGNPDLGPGDGDKNISHIIFCGPSETTTTTTTEETTTTTETTDTFTSDTGGETDAPSEPNTATIGGTNTGAPADGAWLLVIALGVLLASIVVLTPAKARR